VTEDGSAAAATGTADSAAAQDRSESGGGLQSRLVIGKTVLRQGEPIEVKVLLRNASDKPVRYDGREVGFAEWGGWTLFEVAPDSEDAAGVHGIVAVAGAAGLADARGAGQTRGVSACRIRRPEY